VESTRSSESPARTRGSKGVGARPPPLGIALIDRMRDDPDPYAVPPSVEATLRSSGQPMEPGVRGLAEQHFGRDFGRVRIHSDRPAAASAAEICAHAYSLGSHIVFAADKYAPMTTTGRQRLFHELAHVLQRPSGAATPTGPLRLGAADASHERAARAAAHHAPAYTSGGALPSQVVAREVDEQAERRQALALLAEATLSERPIPPPPAPVSADPPDKVKAPIFPITATNVAGSSGLTAVELTNKRTEYPRSTVESVALPGGQPGQVLTIIGTREGGVVRSTESTQSAAVTPAGALANTKQIDSEKTSTGVTFGTRGGASLPDGTEVTDRDAELFLGQSEKVQRSQIANKAATTDATTLKTFQGSKLTINGFDAAGDFRENETVIGKESRRTVATTESRDAGGRVVANERSTREITTDGRSTVNLRNTGSKNQALDLGRVEALTGENGRAARRSERLAREVDHRDGSKQIERSTVENRGRVTTRETSARLSGGREQKVTTQSTRGSTVSNKLSVLSRDEAAGNALSAKLSAEAAYGARSATSFTRNKPGAAPIAPRVQQTARVLGGRLGLVTPTPVDPRTVVAGDKAAFARGDETAPATYQESLAFTGSSRVQKTDEYEVNDRGVSANVAVEAEAGTLRNFLRKDRLNFGWLVVENAMTDYYLAGVSGKLAGGVKAGLDVNNVNVGASASAGYTRKLGNEVTIRIGGAFVKIKAEADAFAGVEAALSAEGGHTRGAGAGAGINASAFAGVRAGLGGRLEGGFQGVSFAAGSYKLRGSLGAGFKANLEARYQNGYVLLAGGLALSAELGVGADVELRISPNAVAASLVKGLAALPNIQNLDLRKAASGAYDAAGDVASGAYGLAKRGAHGVGRAARWARGLF
jgi:hypothetical protein